jgi:hypothetical protein
VRQRKKHITVFNYSDTLRERTNNLVLDARAEAAADTTHNRRVMSQTSSERRRFPVCAGSTLAAISLDSIHGDQCTRRASAEPCAKT